MTATGRTAFGSLALLCLACGTSADDGAQQTVGSTDTAATDPSTSESGGSRTGTASASSAQSSDAGDTGTTASDDGTGEAEESGDSGPSGVGPSRYCGEALFAEPFEDTDFAARGWYDALSGSLSTTEAIPGSTASLECRYAPGATGCEGGSPGRHLFEPQDSVCLSYWVKYSTGFIGSGVGYHPHEFHFVTNLDGEYIGPAATTLTTYTEQVGGVPRLAIQDSLNVDLNCVLLNNDDFVGCNGDFDSYVFSENRSAAACNGIIGDLDGRDCFSTGDSYYSSRYWDADQQVFALDDQWHHVVSYWSLNDIEGGEGIPNGQVRYWVDDQLLISHDQLLMRTGAHPDMGFNQFLLAPYIGDGSPIDQTMWVDDLVVHVGTP